MRNRTVFNSSSLVPPIPVYEPKWEFRPITHKHLGDVARLHAYSWIAAVNAQSPRSICQDEYWMHMQCFEAEWQERLDKIETDGRKLLLAGKSKVAEGMRGYFFDGILKGFVHYGPREVEDSLSAISAEIREFIVDQRLWHSRVPREMLNYTLQMLRTRGSEAFVYKKTHHNPEAEPFYKLMQNLHSTGMRFVTIDTDGQAGRSAEIHYSHIEPDYLK